MKDNPHPVKILSIGEVLWDLLPSGRKVGGAPANFSYHCRQLGGNVRLVSRVGNDPLGRELLDFYRNLDLSADFIGIDESAPTGTVDVEVREEGQPRYTINENVAWDRLEATPDALQWASESDAVCFGSLAARSEQNRRTIRSLLAAAKPETLRVLDLNLRDPFCERKNVEFVLSEANVLKLNDEELNRAAGMFGFRARTIEEQLRELLQRFRFRLVVLTCGANGSRLATDSEQIFTPGQKVDVVDTVGAGDAFTAVAIIDYLKGKPLDEIGRRATDLASFVCSRPGATPTIPERFRTE